MHTRRHGGGSDGGRRCPLNGFPSTTLADFPDLSPQLVLAAVVLVLDGSITSGWLLRETAESTNPDGER